MVEPKRTKTTMGSTGSKRGEFVQGVPTSLGYAKCNVLKLRKVCERSELRLQNIDPIKRGKY